MKKRLYRSEKDRVLGGICGGLGEYLGIDPVFTRVFFIAWAILGEFSVLIYIILWIVLPNESEANASGNFTGEDLGARFRLMSQEIGLAVREPSSKLFTYVGIGTISWGVYNLLRRMGISWDYTNYLGPALLILAGVYVLIRARRQK